MTFAFVSQARVLFFMEPTLKNWFLSNWFGPFHQGTKWHMNPIIKTNEKQVYSHFRMKLNYSEIGKGNKHNFVSWSYPVPFCNEFSDFPNFKLNIKYFISIGFVLIFLSPLLWMFQLIKNLIKKNKMLSINLHVHILTHIQKWIFSCFSFK
jgi:hypothetical protein